MMTPEIVKMVFLPVISTLSRDNVPNIRMNVSKTIQVY
jgi:hypothetical protein